MTSRRPAPAAVHRNYVDGVREVSGSKPCCHPTHHALTATQRYERRADIPLGLLQQGCVLI
jgi:hypothetical protein